MPKRTTISCSNCAVTADVPVDGDYRPLWEAGWRWIGSWELFSCPPCPPVVVVDQEGRHQRGPGVRTGIPA
ncbi:hypothetical protein [Streptomyces scabiei]|uniref:hypothetical protein n=1 Tax=Streptomyces scabiei TaxID=1930 RepID=UPI0004E6C04D|nr:hypothetical protein [Streptomyces scabiei]KFG02758.1 hypothetical protein IQ62_00130 [Streptomyces scabiei]MDX2800184.1 hypothetical protein [Streptomyces scabiei]MDX3126953.1 hypothetical protein [Streptomyces scabiei]